MGRVTHTFVTLELSQVCFDEIRSELKEAGYDHAFIKDEDGLKIDMHGLAVTRGEQVMPNIKAPLRQLDGKKAMVLYFETEEDRQEVLDGLREAKPRMKAYKLP